jgi:hypothetical protein
MNERIRAGLRHRRLAQRAGWAGLVGLFACFLVLLLLEHRLEKDARVVRGGLVVCLLAHFASIAYLRLKSCPSCGGRFLGSGARGFGSFTAMSQDRCAECGAALTSDATG